ncbi:MAG: hypothetical protein AAGL10_10180 [Pseudomonadota bacterium]
MQRAFLIAPLLMATHSCPSMAQSTGPLIAALDAKTSGPVYSYQLDITVDDFTGRARIYPDRAIGKRVAMISPKRTALTSDERKGLKDIDKDASEDFWCHHFAKRIPRKGARLVRQTASTATYRFNPLPDPKDKDDAKLMKHLTGTVTVAKDRPAILSFALSAPKSFKPAVVARVDTFSLKAQCDRSPDGRTFVKTIDLKVTGSAMLQSFEDKQSRRHSALRRIAD